MPSRAIFESAHPFSYTLSQTADFLLATRVARDVLLARGRGDGGGWSHDAESWCRWSYEVYLYGSRNEAKTLHTHKSDVALPRQALSLTVEQVPGGKGSTNAEIPPVPTSNAPDFTFPPPSRLVQYLPFTMSAPPARTTRQQARSSSLPLLLLSILAMGVTLYFTLWDAIRAEIASHTGVHIDRRFWEHAPELYNKVRSGQLEMPQELKDLKERLWDSWYSQGFKWGEELSIKGKAVWAEYNQKKSEL